MDPRSMWTCFAGCFHPLQPEPLVRESSLEEPCSFPRRLPTTLDDARTKFVVHGMHENVGAEDELTLKDADPKGIGKLLWTSMRMSLRLAGHRDEDALLAHIGSDIDPVFMQRTATAFCRANDTMHDLVDPKPIDAVGTGASSSAGWRGNPCSRLLGPGNRCWQGARLGRGNPVRTPAPPLRRKLRGWS
jgi:hypothetical protein